MDIQAMKSMLQHRPLIPFKVCLTDCNEYEVTRPEMATVKPGVLVLDLGPRKGRNPGGVVYCSLDHIVSLETLRPV
jgi:hypothetical protein